MRSTRLAYRTPRSTTYKMPCYSVVPVYRRNVHHNPFFGPQSISVFPRFASPFLRSLEDDLAQFDSFFKEINETVAAKKSFQPRFDIKEESDKFILNGELPGVQAEHLQVEFVDRNTLVVKGKVVRQETHGTPPAEKAQETQGDVTMSGAQPEGQLDVISDTQSEHSNYHKASVEDERAETTEETNTITSPAENQVAKSTPQEVTKPAEQPQPHYWVSERTVGEFSRAFKFPGKVNQDEVKAGLKDGILTVTIAKQIEGDHRRKIDIQGA